MKVLSRKDEIYVLNCLFQYLTFAKISSVRFHRAEYLQEIIEVFFLSVFRKCSDEKVVLICFWEKLMKMSGGKVVLGQNQTIIDYNY